MTSFKGTLFGMLKELNNYHNDPAKLIEFYINKRLNDSLAAYYDTLDKSITYLSKKNELKILKQLGKEED